MPKPPTSRSRARGNADRRRADPGACATTRRRRRRKKSVRETVGDYLATNPAPEAMLAKGKEYRAGWRDERRLPGVAPRGRSRQRAGRSSSSPRFYDPLMTPPKAGFTPDGARAADWYERAALAGNAEAQRKYGLLLAKGGAGLPADPGRAKAWLQQAAAQNDAEAKKALETLPK